MALNAEQMRAFTNYKRYVAEWVERKKTSGKKELDRVWQPLRFCHSDFYLAIMAVRSTRTHYEVGLFAAADHRRFLPGAPLVSGVLLMLADSFRKTGGMEIRFRGARPGEDETLATGFMHGIPREVCRLAESHGISELPKEVLAEVERCKVDPVDVCFYMQRGTWSRRSIELLVKRCMSLRRLLQGLITPLEWGLFKHNLLVMRKAIMAERVVTFFSLMAEERQGVVVRTSWGNDDQLLVTLNFDAKLEGLEGGKVPVQAGTPIPVFLMAREQVEYPVFRESIVRRRGVGPELHALSRDFGWVDASTKAQVQGQARRDGITLLQMIDTVEEIDREAQARIAQCASTREPLSERGD
jgi:hypothetical protein